MTIMSLECFFKLLDFEEVLLVDRVISVYFWLNLANPILSHNETTL